jgi:hypothetical protein
MQGKPIENDGKPEGRLSDDGCERAVLFFLLELDRPVWTVGEIAREIGHAIDAEDACSRLNAGGLIHRFGEFVVASWAAQRAHELPG